MARLACTLVVVVFALLCMNVDLSIGQAAAPAPTLDCTDSLTDLLPCLDYVTSQANNISADCCTGLGLVMASSPLCLCSFVSPGNSSSAADLGINTTRALELPGFCKVKVNPEDCPASEGAPATAPVFSPATAPVFSPATAPVFAPATAPVPSPLVPAASPHAMMTPAPSSSPVSAPAKSPMTAPVMSPTMAPPKAQLPPPAECSGKVTQLAPCLGFVTGKTNPPSAECCTQFGAVVKTSPLCLCSLITDGSSSSADVPGLNKTLALMLPSFCSVTVDLNKCSDAAGSAMSPSGPVAPTGAPLSMGSLASPLSMINVILAAAIALRLLQ